MCTECLPPTSGATSVCTWGGGSGRCVCVCVGCVCLDGLRAWATLSPTTHTHTTRRAGRCAGADLRAPARDDKVQAAQIPHRGRACHVMKLPPLQGRLAAGAAAHPGRADALASQAQPAPLCLPRCPCPRKPGCVLSARNSQPVQACWLAVNKGLTAKCVCVCACCQHEPCTQQRVVECVPLLLLQHAARQARGGWGWRGKHVRSKRAAGARESLLAGSWAAAGSSLRKGRAAGLAG